MTDTGMLAIAGMAFAPAVMGIGIASLISALTIAEFKAPL